jgi:hypothetical protein
MAPFLKLRLAVAVAIVIALDIGISTQIALLLREIESSWHCCVGVMSTDRNILVMSAILQGLPPVVD